MSLLPIFLKLEGRACLVVGAGVVATDKVTSLLKTGARLCVIAPEARAEIRALAESKQIEWAQREFVPGDLDGRQVVIAATNRPELNAAVYREAAARGVLCNSVDDIPHCDFYFGSVVSRGALQIAISTSGESPAFAQRLRKEIDALLPGEIGPWLADLGNLRREILAALPAGEERKKFLHELAQRGPGLRESPSHTADPSRRGREAAAPGKVWLVGAGPGDPDLLTLKAFRLIQSADVILHDDLVPRAILDLATCAELLDVGKRCGAKRITQEEINTLMIAHAGAGRKVVRLKSGDPLIFGRAAEEMDALKAAGVAFEVVPGITSALAAAAAIPASITGRRTASSVIFATGHHAQSHSESAIPAIEDATRVVYMPGRELSLLASQWVGEGLPPDWPCVLVSRAAQPGQVVRHTTLAALGGESPMQAPSLLLAGWALAQAASSAFAEEVEERVLA
jgi:uroporphyrin-III C-methyltransferase/precorrin-2 dehydrogenase/sirohydrochlorin ferrochelatase